MNYKNIILALIASTAVAAGAQAEVYVGAGVGKSTTDAEDLKDTNGMNLTAGYKFGDYLAVQASYVDLGSFDLEMPDFNYPDVTVTASASIDITGYEAAVVGFLPINDKFRAFARVGLFAWDAEANATFAIDGVAESDSRSESGTDGVYAIGAQYNLTEAWAVEAEWATYDSTDEGVNVLGVGVKYFF